MRCHGHSPALVLSCQLRTHDRAWPAPTLQPPGSVRNEDLNLPLALYVRAACSGGTLALEGAPCGPPGEDGSGDDESPETLRLAYSVIEKMGMKVRWLGELLLPCTS